MESFIKLQEISFFFCVAEYKISDHNILDQIKVLLFNLERVKYCFVWAWDWKNMQASNKWSAQHHHLEKKAESCSILQAPYELWMWQQASGNILL